MSIDSSDFGSQNTNSSGNRAPPPPFSSQTFSHSRKRPALSNLGIEVSLASDVKTPNTPTPNFATEPLDSSDAVLKVRPTPTEPIDPSSYQQHHSDHYSDNHGYQHPKHHNQHYSRNYDVIREPQLTIVLDALSDFQHFYDQKSQKIDNMEMQLRHLNDLLHQRESELQSFSKERIENLRILESNKLQLKELEGKLKDFNKYEKMITTKFGDLESLMQELSITRTKYSQKETELKKDLENREIKLNEALRSIQELRIEKETLETQKQTLENENKDQCTEFNGKICGLNTEIKDKKRLIELLSGEKEVLLSDLKNITKDRDRIQRECSMALKEITDLAMNSECSAKDLSSLECSVAWIKGKCKELETEKISRDLDLVNLKQTVQELEKVVTIKNEELKQKEVEINKLKSDLDEFESVKVAMDKYENEISLLNEFKKKAQGLGFQDDSSLFDKIYEKLSHKTSERKLESLQNELNQLRKKHEVELSEQKEEYGRLLRGENSKWKVEKEQLESEISKLKKTPTSKTTSISSKSHDADLTAFIKDLKESANNLSNTNLTSTGKTQGKRPASNNNRFLSNTKRRMTAGNNSQSSQNSQKLSSPSSVNSNDIWNLFK